MSRNTVKLNGRELSLSNLEKDLYPAYGFTKARVLEYYGRIAPFILPHLKDRALTLKRYPDGAEEEYFFEKRCPEHRPAWLKTAEVRHGKETLTACLVDGLEALIWVENLASLELHVPLARASSPGTPDSVVFDLDPGEGAGMADCVKTALLLKDLLAGMGLSCLVKTSGKKGLHVYAPLNSKGTTFEKTKAFSKAVAELLQKNYPSLVTSQMAKELRRKKVFINWSQNDPSKTMVCAYSLRAGEVPLVSCPLDWKELESLPARKLSFTHAQAVRRAESRGDLLRGLLVKKQRLPFL